MYSGLPLADESWTSAAIDRIAEFGSRYRDELDTANRNCVFPRDLYREMGRRGWIGAFTPPEYGGSGFGISEYCVILEEVARHGLVTPQVAYQGQRWLLDWGTKEQQDAYLEGLATGATIFSESISEPGVGSSFKQMRATAVRRGSDWEITGDKIHVNLGQESDITLVYAMAEDLGLTAFIVPMDAHGISTRQTEPIGLRLIPTAEIRFEGVRVPSSAVLGSPGKGLETFFTTFNVSRLGNASELIGFCRRALVSAIDYARERPVGDRVVLDFQGIQWTIADCYTSVDAAALARNQAAGRAQSGEEHSFHTSVAKKLAIEAAEKTANEVFSLVGGHGLYPDEPYGQLLHDVKVLRVAGGSLEVLRNYVASQIIGSESLRGLR